MHLEYGNVVVSMSLNQHLVVLKLFKVINSNKYILLSIAYEYLWKKNA